MNKWKKNKRQVLTKKHLNKALDNKVTAINYGVEYYQKVEENENTRKY